MTTLPREAFQVIEDRAAATDEIFRAEQRQHARGQRACHRVGGDNASRTTLDQVLQEAQASNAAIYTVGIIDPLDREAKPQRLKRLAQARGGGCCWTVTALNLVEPILLD